MIRLRGTSNFWRYFYVFLGWYMDGPDLTASLMFDRKRSFAFTVPPRIPITWIPDCRVTRCFKCKTLFGWTVRKHHCRSCGRIFCYACSSYMINPPTYGDGTSNSQRMCGPCAEKARLSSENESLIISLTLIPVTMHELWFLRLMDKKWNFAVNHIFSYHRGLQYKITGQPYCIIEKQFLWTHFREFVHHIALQIHAIVSNSTEPNWLQTLNAPKFRDKISCRMLLCSKTCCPELSMSDIIRLGLTNCFRSLAIQKWVIVSWRHVIPTVHIRMMSWWVYFSVKWPRLFEHGLVPIANGHLNIAYALWFECEIQKNTENFLLLQKIQNMIGNNTIKTELFKSNRLCELLRSLGKSPNESKVRAFFETYGHTRLPWNANLIVTDIYGFKRLSSASKPIVCTFRIQKKEIHILIKNEDVRTDRLAMDISYWIATLTKNIIMPVYQVFPLDRHSGCVEMIPNATTLYDIREKSSLLNFIMSNCPEIPSKVIRERLVSSSAGACLLAFAMGLGDRHLENIMITKSGYLAHVDFGYILGDDPKVFTPMRITEDMVDALGGQKSKTFQNFVQRTQSGYETMRSHSNFWYQLLVSHFYIYKDNTRCPQRVKEHILDRFVPGEWTSEASLQIQTVVQKAAESSWIQKFADLTHAASNQFGEFVQNQKGF
jgi:hypothetical protein